VDGTTAPNRDWNAIPDLFSGKTGYPGMNLQIAATQGAHSPLATAATGPPDAELGKTLPDEDFRDFRSRRKAECLCPWHATPGMQ
jgi:hypothetical protein